MAYGFEKEFEENIKVNAPYKKLSEQEFREKIYKSLNDYADAHEKLPVHNKAQQEAKLVAVSLGRRKFRETIHYLEELQKHLNSRDEWISFAHEGV